MSNGRLKASYNRVRTSVALKQTSIWTNTIGLEDHSQSAENQEVEKLLNAPPVGGAARTARQQAAAEVVERTGAFDTSLTNYQELLSIARLQGAVGDKNRGACKICGQLGHLTKQCRNHLSKHYRPDDAARAGTALIVGGEEAGDGGEESSGLSGLSDITSDSSSDSDAKRKEKRKRKHKSKEKSSKLKEKSSKHRSKEKSSKSKTKERHKEQQKKSKKARKE